ncbi:MAG: methionyl-tRNA formyltransferase [Candidatus Berkelbacteria bacterium]|nr:methionyl-tRNA formyltransferase [Candidatus Berkelbacteria bacterium]
MKKREILKDPNPVLRAETEDVLSFDGEIQELIDDMIYTMRNADGIGLAAPQVGVGKKIIVAEYETPEKSEDDFPLAVVVNPKIEAISEDDQEFMIEGCLSFPGTELYIKRPKKVKVTALDRWGKEYTLEDEKLLARVLQHEIDHLNGILMIDHIKVVKTLFIGNGSLGQPVLERITNDPQFELLAAFTTVDRPAGRSGELQPTMVAELAAKLNQKTFKIEDINSKEIINQIKSLNPELIVLADFSQIISKDLINLPKYGILNIHPSLLPKYRGPSPVVTAILNGDKKTGVSIIKLSDKIDAGDILSQLEIRIRPRENADQLKNRLAEFGADLLAETVPYYLADEIHPIKQIEEKVSYTKKFSKEDGKISNQPAERVELMVRALNPWPGVYTTVGDKKVFITKSHLDKEKKLVIEIVKPEGKREMTYKEYLAGNSPLTITE